MDCFHCVLQDLHWQGLCRMPDKAAGCGKHSACKFCDSYSIVARRASSRASWQGPVSLPSCGSHGLILPQVFPVPPISRGSHHGSSSWGAEAWAATPLYSGNVITSDRVCYTFAVGASDVQMTLERLHIQGQLAPEGEMCKLFPEDNASAVHGSLLAVQGSLAQGWCRACTSPLPIVPGAGRVQGSPQGPCPFCHLCSCPGPAKHRIS